MASKAPGIICPYCNNTGYIEELEMDCWACRSHGLEPKQMFEHEKLDVAVRALRTLAEKGDQTAIDALGKIEPVWNLAPKNSHELRVHAHGTSWEEVLQDIIGSFQYCLVHTPNMEGFSTIGGCTYGRVNPITDEQLNKARDFYLEVERKKYE